MSKDTENIIPRSGSVLYVDVGNSSIKVAFQDRRKWQQPVRFEPDNITGLLDWINSRAGKFRLVIIASVVREVTQLLTDSIREIPCRILEAGDIPADLLDYETPETLGIDRFLACYGAVARNKSACVVIDSGTACTIDYITGDCVYEGGVIMPGIAVFEQALKLHAPVLPTVCRTLPASWPGKSTAASLQWGVTGAFLDGIHSALNRYKEQFNNFSLVLTGGDAEWMASVLQWKAEVCPLLVFEGMKQFVKEYG